MLYEVEIKWDWRCATFYLGFPTEEHVGLEAGAFFYEWEWVDVLIFVFPISFASQERIDIGRALFTWVRNRKWFYLISTNFTVLEHRNIKHFMIFKFFINFISFYSNYDKLKYLQYLYVYPLADDENELA